MERVRAIWDFLRTSFWFVPTLMAVGALGLMLLTISAERGIAGLTAADAPWFVYVGKPANALSVLSTVLSSMITMASLVFSITMVVLTLAASQFGPRLIRNFMANPQTQLVLGAFVMTSVYCLLALPVVEMRDGGEKLPYVSVTVALSLTLLSIGLLVLFLDTLARSIVSETVIERVGRELDDILSELPPLSEAYSMPGPPAVIPPDFERSSLYCGPNSAGYVQAIQFEDLVSLAEQEDVVLGLYFRAGHYVVPGAREIGIYPKERATEYLVARVRACIMVGVHRTPIQDPDFAIRHLDEIATRALSRAVNDPYTAVAVIDRVSASLCFLLGRALPSGEFRDGRGVVRVLATEPSYRGLIGAAFNQIRQHGCGTPIIVLHLLEAIERIGQHICLPNQHDALVEQASSVIAAAHRCIPDPLDLKTIDERFRRVRRTLDAAKANWVDVTPQTSRQVEAATPPPDGPPYQTIVRGES